MEYPPTLLYVGNIPLQNVAGENVSGDCWFICIYPGSENGLLMTLCDNLQEFSFAKMFWLFSKLLVGVILCSFAGS